MEDIEKHPNKPWDWKNISKNQILLEDIEKHQTNLGIGRIY